MSDRITDEKEVADLREQLAAAQSREVCTVAHSDEVMEFCPYCKIERLRGDLSEIRIALANAECREGVAKAWLAEVAAIANDGGLCGMSEADALVAIRRLTLPYWNKSGSEVERAGRVTASVDAGDTK